MRRSIIAFLFAVWAAVSGAYDWSNLTPEKRLGGRMVSAGYLRGKVVVLDCRDYGDKANFPAIRELQQLWACHGSRKSGGASRRSRSSSSAAIADREARNGWRRSWTVWASPTRSTPRPS